MAWDTASPAVRQALTAGAFWFLRPFAAGFVSFQQAWQRLYSTFSQNPQFTQRAARAILDRYQAARQAGQLLASRGSQGVLTRAEHVGYVGIPNRYQYQVRVQFGGGPEGGFREKLFLVDSDQPMTAGDVYRDAFQQAHAAVDNQAYLTRKWGRGTWDITGHATIAMALYRLP